MSERDRIEQALTFDTGCEPSAQEIIDALNRAGYQITPQAGEAESVSDGFARYRYKAQFRELRPYVAGETLSEHVSIGKQDKENGSPRVGDMIARNPKNHNDQWLIAAQYFAENFEVNRTAPPRPAYVGVDLASGPDVTAIQHKDGSIEYRTAPPPPVCPHPSVGLIHALMCQKQCDEDGVEVRVSRQALDEAIEILRALPPSPVGPGWQPTHRHVENGSLYQLIGTTKIRTTKTWCSGVLYRNELGEVFTRFVPNFNERFVSISPLPSPPDSPGAEEL